MIDRLPRRLRLGFSRSQEPAAELVPGTNEVAFVAYGEDCILSGRTVLDAERLTDMLNSHDEYALEGVTVERFDSGEPMEVAEIVVPRDEIFLVHASGPRGDPARRHRTLPQHLALGMGPYEIRGDFHALPGADPVAAMRRRKVMVPLTDASVGYTVHGQRRETRVDTLILNRDQIDWVEAAAAARVELADATSRLITGSA